MEKVTQLAINLPLFEPISRYAILLNNYDIFKGYSQAETLFRGNRGVYELEAILTGKFSPGAEELRPILEERLPLRMGHELGLHSKYRLELPYESVTRVLPGDSMRTKLRATLKKVADLSDDNTLTFLYIISHGGMGSFVVDNRESMGYQALLDQLDKIKGKKVMIAFACYSGSLLDILEQRPARGSYLVLTSTSNGEEGSTWGEDKLHNLLVENMLDKKRMSDLRLPISIEGHQPQIRGWFDVVL